MDKNCITCQMKQVEKIADMLNLEENIENRLLELVKTHMESVDTDKPSPQVMGEIWAIIASLIHTDDPYQQIKHYYNQEVLKMNDDLYEMIHQAKDPFTMALKMSIVGNLIDFSAKHTFDLNTFNERLKQIQTTPLSIDDEKILYNDILKAKTLLYLGDNCGEIVLDKLFIQQIKKTNPDIKIYFAVRGQAIANDVTIIDANEVNMEEAAIVVSNGSACQGTILDQTSQEFQDLFNHVDVIISKGQGNYEGLMNHEKENIYFLFMAKCEMIAIPIKVPTLSIVCMKNRIHTHS